MSYWKKALTFITLLLLSLFGLKPTYATTATFNEGERLLAQSCAYGEQRQSYSKVRTRQGDPLNVRSSPNGKVIGAIPNGWAVVPVRTDSTGKWVRIKSHFGEVDGAYSVFYSAPAFRSGWVWGGFLRPLGRFCDKPVSFIHSDMDGLFANKQVLINEDWVQIGDRISQDIPKQ